MKPSPDSLTPPPFTLMDTGAPARRMTRDHRRDLEAAGVIVGWYCNLCNRAIPIEDEITAERYWRMHMERHRQREKAKAGAAGDSRGASD